MSVKHRQTTLVPIIADGTTHFPHDPKGTDNGGFVLPSDNNKRPYHESDWVFEESSDRIVTTSGNITCDTIKETVRRGCSLTAWRRRLPISYWLPKYSVRDFKGDFIAGLTVGLTVVPQGLAYAAIAEVPLEYGLYSAFMGCFMYTLFGTAKDITLGPTAVLSLMTAAAFPKGASALDKANYAVILSFFTGVSQFLLGVFNLGFLVDFISAPVISGFTTASAFIIVVGQVKTLIGVKFNADNIPEYVVGYWNNIRSINGWDTLMGIICLSILLLMKEMKLPKKPLWNIKKRQWTILREIVRICCVTRYAMVIIVATGVGYAVTVGGYKGLSITNEVRGGIPSIGPPPFTWNNRTSWDTFSVIAKSIPMVVLVGALESIAVAKAFAFQFQYRIEPTQELIALGLSNILCSMFHGYPVTGSFTRSALKAQCGVRTPLGCSWTGMFVLLAMAVISPAFKYVPKAALSGVIIAAILILFEFKIFKDLWLINKKELLSIGVTIIVAFVTSVDIGILSGIGVSMLLLLYPIARPIIVAHFKESLYSLRPHQNPATGKREIHVDVTPQGAIFFPAAEYLKDFFQENIVAQNYNEQSVSTHKPDSAGVPLKLDIAEIKEEVIFNGIHLTQSDYTTLRALRSVVMNCKKANKTISFINTEPEVLKIVLPKEMRTTVEPDDEKSGSIRSRAPGMDVSTINLSKSTAERMASYSQEAIDAMESADPSTRSRMSEETFDDDHDYVAPEKSFDSDNHMPRKSE